MTRMPWPVLEAFARRLGFDVARPRVLPVSTVELILRRLIELRQGSGGKLDVSVPVSPEPDALHLVCTISTKVGRCPLHTFAEKDVPWLAPAVEVVAMVGPLLTQEKNELAELERSARRGGPEVPPSRVAAYKQAEDIYRRLRRSREYDAGIEQLAVAFGECEYYDESFRKALARWTRQRLKE